VHQGARVDVSCCTVRQQPSHKWQVKESQPCCVAESNSCCCCCCYCCCNNNSPPHSRLMSGCWLSPAHPVPCVLPPCSRAVLLLLSAVLSCQLRVPPSGAPAAQQGGGRGARLEQEGGTTQGTEAGGATGARRSVGGALQAVAALEAFRTWCMDVQDLRMCCCVARSSSSW
jgi:hypothetical protein